MTMDAPGPIGKPRSVPLTILVTIVTFFIWAMVWSFLTGEDLKKYRGEGLGGLVYLIITFILFVVIFLIVRVFRVVGQGIVVVVAHRLVQGERGVQ